MRPLLVFGPALLVMVLGCTSDPTVDSKPRLEGCLDQPGQLARPPEGSLPCELVPPGVVIGE